MSEVIAEKPPIKMTLKVMKSSESVPTYKPARGNYNIVPRVSRFKALFDRILFEIGQCNFAGDDPDTIVFDMESSGDEKKDLYELKSTQLAIYNLFRTRKMNFRCLTNRTKNALFIEFVPGLVDAHNAKKLDKANRKD